MLAYSKAAMARTDKVVSSGVPTKVPSKRLIRVRCRRHSLTTKASSRAAVTLRTLNGSRTMMIPLRITTDSQGNLGEEALSQANKAISTSSKIKRNPVANSSNNKIISKIRLRPAPASLP